MSTAAEIQNLIPETVLGARLTAIKVAHLTQHRGMHITGFLLTDPKTGEEARVQYSQVLWTKPPPTPCSAPKPKNPEKE